MKHILCFFLCLLYIMAEIGTISGTQSLAPSTLTRPMNSNLEISPTLTIILACLVLFLMAVVFVYIRRMSPDSFDESLGFHFMRHRPTVSRGLDSNIIKSFPIFRYSDVKALKLGKSILECAVCLNEFEDEETLRLLPNCYHVFHLECIDAWLAFRTTCPVCRANLKKKLGEVRKLVQQTDTNSVTSHLDIERSETVLDIQVTDVGPQEVINTSPQTSIHSHNIPNCSHAASKTPDFRHVAPKSTPRRPKILGMFSRSHSTGHSLIQPGQNYERFTLRLPDDVQKGLVDLSLNRAYNSEALLSLERSSTKGYRFEPGSSKNSLKSVKSPLSLFCGTEKDDTGERSFTYLRSNASS
ncbi:E3 ubiquitin-protein ligase ATL6-like [Lycium ferocissimum]|uniref:E3 ubiquitin-protein ligase ATL6-like n=1 Tax=Lycium ferocissimum TaxID=112874 RepID=UPI002815B237|nr:E3 ubiquitin-protein ligase ATL6-like [Lycium ferocissimum]